MTKHLILRTCNADMRSYGGFQWPRSGPVVAPDWNSRPECGNGLHGFLRGEGVGGLADWSSDAVWIVAEVETFVDLGGKVKFPSAEVIFAGSRLEATALVKARYPDAAVIGAHVTVEDRRVAVVGDRGTATAGDYGAATAGNRGVAAAGDNGMLQVYYRDDRDRLRLAIAYVGEEGVLPNVKYRLDGNAKFVPA